MAANAVTGLKGLSYFLEKPIEYSGPYYTTIPQQSTPVIPLQSTPLINSVVQV